MEKIIWKTDPCNPVIRPGVLHPGLDDNKAGACHVLDMGDRLRMYYWGTGKKGNVILAAESPGDKPNSWEPLNGCLLEPQPNTSHNSGGPSFPFVIPLTEKKWHMYFVGWGNPKPDGKLPNTTNLAVSNDAGITWKYYEKNPIIPLDKPWDKEGTGSVSVIKLKNQLWMYYTAIGEYFDKPKGVRTGHGNKIPKIGIALAKSKDGINWEKHNELVLAPRGFNAEPYEYINSKPFVLPEEKGFRMWFSSFGYAYRIQEAVSQDGIKWAHVTNNADSYFGIGQEGAFDDKQRSYACIVKRKDIYHMWYTGNGFGSTGIGYAIGNAR